MKLLDIEKEKRAHNVVSNPRTLHKIFLRQVSIKMRFWGNFEQVPTLKQSQITITSDWLIDSDSERT